MCLSSEKSATSRFNRLFSSSNCRSRRSSLTPRCAYFFFQAQNVASLTPRCRQRSPMEVPASACRIAYTICSSENFDRFIGPLLSCETAEAAILLQFQAAVVFGGDVTHLLTLLQNPYSDQPGMDAYAAPPPNWSTHLAVSCSS